MSNTASWESREAAEAWRRGAPNRLRVNAAVFDRLLAEARLAPGMRVLDVGAGTGDQTMLIVERIGPTGSVLAIDLSAAMLELLEEDARAAGHANVATRAGDLLRMELEPAAFDAAVSTNCLQFISDPIEALRRVRAALKPGARLAAIVGSTPERNPMINLVQTTVRRVGGLPELDPDQPGFHALSRPGHFESVLSAAGFAGVVVHPMPSVRRSASATAFVESMPTNPNFAVVLDQLDESTRARALKAVEDELRELAPTGELNLPGEMLLGCATA